MDDLIDVELWVEEAAKSNIKRFYPTALGKSINLPLHSIFQKLLMMSKENKLEVFWEIRCPECYSTCLTMTNIIKDSSDFRNHCRHWYHFLSL